MYYMLASDIHGSAKYCREMFRRFEEEQADRLILLGDLLYHGPRNDLPEEYAPKEVIQMLNDHKDSIFCVRGNCEAEVDQMVLEFPVLADYALLSAGKRMLFLTHGHHAGEKTPPPMQKGDILITGHTHVPACVEYENYTYLNPGSVSIPKESSRHSYMTFDGKTFQWKDVSDGAVWKKYDVGGSCSR